MMLDEIKVARLWVINDDRNMNVALELLFFSTRPTAGPSGFGTQRIGSLIVASKI